MFLLGKLGTLVSHRAEPIRESPPSFAALKLIVQGRNLAHLLQFIWSLTSLLSLKARDSGRDFDVLCRVDYSNYPFVFCRSVYVIVPLFDVVSSIFSSKRLYGSSLMPFYLWYVLFGDDLLARWWESSKASKQATKVLICFIELYQSPSFPILSFPRRSHHFSSNFWRECRKLIINASPELSSKPQLIIYLINFPAFWKIAQRVLRMAGWLAAIKAELTDSRREKRGREREGFLIQNLQNLANALSFRPPISRFSSQSELSLFPSQWTWSREPLCISR